MPYVFQCNMGTMLLLPLPTSAEPSDTMCTVATKPEHAHARNASCEIYKNRK